MCKYDLKFRDIQLKATSQSKKKKKHEVQRVNEEWLITGFQSHSCTMRQTNSIFDKGYTKQYSTRICFDSKCQTIINKKKKAPTVLYSYLKQKYIFLN